MGSSQDISAGNDAVHASARERRDEAREGYQLLAGLAAAAAGTPVAAEAADLRDAGRARLAASEAWYRWIRDHGV